MMTKSHDIDDEHSVSARPFVRPMLPCLTDCELWFHTILPVLIVLYDDLHTYEQEFRREGWTEKHSAVCFCLGSGLFGNYNSD